ncbi:MAG: DUF433 domain-containing protein [Ktedonobacterales bacterium]
MNTESLIRDVSGELFRGASRVLLQNVVTARARGETPEQIQENFPSLSLSQVYGAITYYLEHQADLDTRFAEDLRTLNELHAKNHAAHRESFDSMHARFEAARGRRHEETAEMEKASQE